MLRLRLASVSIIFVLFLPCLSSAEPLDLDVSFNATGVRTVDFGLELPAANDAGRGVAVQSDNKIIVVGVINHSGQSDIGAIRLHPDGSLDTTFGAAGPNPGLVITDIDVHDIANDVLLQPDGKIVVAGHTGNGTLSSNDVILARYLPNGQLDGLFGNGGIARISLGEFESGKSLGLQSNGRIVVLAAQEMADAIDPYLSDFLVFRFLANGQLDTSFGSLGTVRINFANNWNHPSDLVISNDDRITAVGITAQLTNLIGDKAFGAMARLMPNGTLDTSFDGGLPAICAFFSSCGKVVTDLGGGPYDFPTSVALSKSNGLEDARLVISGQFGIARFETNGAFDVSFAGNGMNTTTVNTGADIAVRNDGSIVRVGASSGDFGIAIYAPDGALDSGCSSGNGFAQTTDFFGLADSASSVAMAPTGQIIAAGVAKDADDDFAIARYRGGACGKTSTGLFGKAFLAYNIFVHPQDKVGPNWPGWLNQLPLKAPTQLFVPMAHGLASPYLSYNVSGANATWPGDTLSVTSALGTTEVKPRNVDSLLIPVHLSTKSQFVSHISGAQGYACYGVDDGAKFARQSVVFENALGDRQRISTSAITLLCAALNQDERHEAIETRYLLCVDALADDWAHGPVEVDADTAIVESGVLQADTAATFCLDAELRAIQSSIDGAEPRIPMMSTSDSEIWPQHTALTSTKLSHHSIHIHTPIH